MSILRCVRFACSAWSSSTRSRIGLTRLNNLEAAASAELPLLQLVYVVRAFRTVGLAI
jgi:hypothetical protein